MFRRISEKALNSLMEKMAKWLGGINGEGFQEILMIVGRLAKQEDLGGRDKFERAVDYAIEMVMGNEVPDWIAHTVVQIIFAIARRKGLA